MATLERDAEVESTRMPRACSMRTLMAICAIEIESREPSQCENESDLKELKERRIRTSVKRKPKHCSTDGCNRLQRSRGLCKAHGGGRRCCMEGCIRSDQGGGFCIRHGGGERCSADGCKNGAQRRNVCKAHGGGDLSAVPKRIKHKAIAEDGEERKTKKLKAKKPKGKTLEAEVPKPVTSGAYMFVRHMLTLERQKTLPSCVAGVAVAEDRVHPIGNSVRPSQPTRRTAQETTTISPHATTPKSEPVSPTTKACAIANWPSCGGPDHSSGSAKPTATVVASDDHPGAVAALLLSLQTQDTQA